MTGNRGIIGRAAGLGLLAGLALCLWPVAPAAGDVIGHWSTATLSQGRYGIAATSVGGMAFFAGGTAQTGGSNVVDIYNSATGSWSTGPALWTRNLSAPPQATSGDGKAFFTQGFDLTIYDTSTALWSTVPLPYSHLQGAIASAGGLVFFGGGNYDTRVDIFNPLTGTWSTRNLSQGRFNLVAASGGGKVFFAGGIKSGGRESDVVDIFDTVTSLWSTARLSEPKSNFAVTSVGGKVFFAGGVIDAAGDASDVVDVYDLNAQTWQSARLAEPRRGLSATSAEGLALFVGGWDTWTGGFTNAVDIFDTSTETWSTGRMPGEATAQGATSVGNQALFAGGSSSSAYHGNAVYVYAVPEPAPAAILAVGGLFILFGGNLRRMNLRSSSRRRMTAPEPAGQYLQPLEQRFFLSGIAWSDAPNPGGGLSAKQVQFAYGFDKVRIHDDQFGYLAEGVGQTIAVVVAYDAPHIIDDLSLVFSPAMNLTPMNMGPYTNTGYLSVVDRNGVSQGQSGFLPQPDQRTGGAYWDYESSFDVEWVHAMAPRANIIVVEATDDTIPEFMAAVNRARLSGASVITMSWQFNEAAVTQFGHDESYYDDNILTPTTGVTFVSASGDKGTTVEWPGISKNVLSVGGTILKTDK